jgi:hypothetical protein
MANLATLQSNAKALLNHFYSTRKTAVDPNGPYANRTFALMPTANQSRLQALIDLMQLQGFDVFQASAEFTAGSAIDQLGRQWTNHIIPAGTILIPNRQPLAHLLAAMLEFDPRIPPAALTEERQELLRKGQSRIYDTTAWNLTMMYGLPALTLRMELPETARPYSSASARATGLVAKTQSPVAYVVDGADDRSVTAAARLLERGLQLRVAEKPFKFDNQDFARGSVVVTHLDNRTFAGDLQAILAKTIAELNLSATGIEHGFGEGELPDLGGQYFKRLEPPRIALLGRGRVSSYDYGSLWYVLDHHLGIRHSQVEESDQLDLSRYNVLVIPDRGAPLPTAFASNLKDWVKAGGTLIAIANAASSFIAEKAEFSKARALPDVLGKLGDYELAIFREWLARFGDLPPADRVWTHTASPTLQYPWQKVDGPHPDEKELKQRDTWQKLFMPQGALLASRVDTNHWLTFGCNDMLPVLVGRQPVLMAAEGVEAPIRYGYLTPTGIKSPPVPAPETKTNIAATADKKEPDKKEKKEPPRVGWAALPEGTEMRLRMSGLLWPEATHRLANAAYVTRESLGRGQIILFATPPTFRAAARGATRLFLNAAIYGPGFGAAQPIRP